jgi:hypothetical protein
VDERLYRREFRMTGAMDDIKAVAGQSCLADWYQGAACKLARDKHVAADRQTLPCDRRFDSVRLLAEADCRECRQIRYRLMAAADYLLPSLPARCLAIGCRPFDLDQGKRGKFSRLSFGLRAPNLH